MDALPLLGTLDLAEVEEPFEDDNGSTSELRRLAISAKYGRAVVDVGITSGVSEIEEDRLFAISAKNGRGW